MIAEVRDELREASSAERARLAGGLAAALMASLLMLTVPVMVGRVTARFPALTAFDLMALAAILAARTAFAFVGSDSLAVVGAEAVSRLRKRLFARLVRAPLAFHGRAYSADLTSMLTADTLFIERSLGALLPAMAQHAPTALGALVIMAVISPGLTLGLAVLLTPPALLALRASRVLQDVAGQAQEDLGRLAVSTQETFQGLEIVKVLRQEGFFIDRVNGDVDRLLALKRKRARVTALIEAAAPAAATAIVVAGLWWGRLWITREGARFDVLAMFSVALVVLAASGRQLLMASGSLAAISGAAERIAAVMRRAEAEPALRPASTAEHGASGPLVLEGVTFRYPHGGGGVSDVRLRVEPGEVVAIVGPNGSGKSTLARLMLGLYHPDGGEIRLGTQVLDGNDLAAWRRRFAYLTGDPAIFSLGAGANIALGRSGASPDAVREAARRVGLDEVLAGLPQGYDTLVGEHGRWLSSGQRQRLVLARLFLQDPDVVVLDEATASLDAEGEAALREALVELAASRIVLIIAHELGDGWPVTRRIRLDAGRVVDDRRLRASALPDRAADGRARRESA